MTEYKPFDIKERSFLFALDCLRLCKTISDDYQEFIMTKQLSRSATSVGANIREAQNGISKRDFIHKLTISQKECHESIYWIELLSAFLELESHEIMRLQKEANELLLILSSIIVKSRNRMLPE
ncbi:four helix bundle protein [Fluviicola sp.]|jgi:four helix bundle protein|uniref:four helix bundle protein n=1 Tax=Fluviicola sp. TaxID=1917219 RepID=UPI00281C7F5B|nr:four helix bundle protein [Fluviicola sp.]MDR0802336.1 four helix bundle protein [Fluviicola sp.]